MRWRRRRDEDSTAGGGTGSSTATGVVDPLNWARTQWEHGDLVPYYLTGALGDRNGPDVDRACGTTEPHVDRWEAGDEYPTWEQVLLLAELCRVHPASLMRRPTDPALAAALPAPTTIWLGRCLAYRRPLVMEFAAHAINNTNPTGVADPAQRRQTT